MKINHILYFLSLSLFVLSCTSEEEQTTGPDMDPTEDTLSNIEEDSTLESDVEFIADDMESWDHLPTTSDDFEFNIGYDNIEIYSEISVERVKMKVESSITVMNEGPHCDLTEWYHGYTDWYELEADELEESAGFDRYMLPAGIREKLPFPITDMDVIRKEVDSFCKDYWAEHIKDVKSPYDYPCDVGISAFILEIAYNLEGEIVPVQIRVLNQMGC